MHKDVLAPDLLRLIFGFFFAFDLELATVHNLLHHTREIRFFIFLSLLTLGFFLFTFVEDFFFNCAALVIVFEEVYDFILQCLLR